MLLRSSSSLRSALRSQSAISSIPLGERLGDVRCPTGRLIEHDRFMLSASCVEFRVSLSRTATPGSDLGVGDAGGAAR